MTRSRSDISLENELIYNKIALYSNIAHLFLSFLTIVFILISVLRSSVLKPSEDFSLFIVIWLVALSLFSIFHIAVILLEFKAKNSWRAIFSSYFLQYTLPKNDNRYLFLLGLYLPSIADLIFLTILIRFKPITSSVEEMTFLLVVLLIIQFAGAQWYKWISSFYPTLRRVKISSIANLSFKSKNNTLRAKDLLNRSQDSSSTLYLVFGEATLAGQTPIIVKNICEIYDGEKQIAKNFYKNPLLPSICLPRSSEAFIYDLSDGNLMIVFPDINLGMQTRVLMS